MPFLMEFLEHQLQRLMVQGKRWTEVQVLKFALQGVNAGRKAYLGIFGLMFFAMVMALSFGATLLIGAFQIQELGGLLWTWPLGTSLIVFLLSLSILIFSSREKTWLKATGLQKRVLEVYGPYDAGDIARRGLPSEPALQMADLRYELRRSVEDIVQKRMHEEFGGLKAELRSLLAEQRQTTTPSDITKSQVAVGLTENPAVDNEAATSRTYTPDGLSTTETRTTETPDTKEGGGKTPPSIH